MAKRSAIRLNGRREAMTQSFICEKESGYV